MTYVNFPTSVWPVLPTVQPIQPTINILPHTVVTPKVTLAEAFKPKAAGKNKSHIIFVLDDSYSMQSCRDATISGFNEYLAGQKDDAEKTGIETFVSLYKFNGSSVICTIDHVPVQSVKPLDRDSYDPRGGTNLLDAMGGVMMQINSKLAAVKKKDRESVIITVQTDGAENSSRTFRNSDIKAMVEKAEGKNWGFMFLGANIDAFGAGAALGFNSHNTIQYNVNATEGSIRAASNMTSRMKSAYSMGMDTTTSYAVNAFTDAERTAAVTPDE